MLVVDVLVGVFFVTVAVDSRYDDELPVVIFAVGVACFMGGFAWTAAEGLIAQTRPALPQARGGALVVEVPDRMRRAYVATAGGGGIAAVGASFLIGAILSDPPEISPWLLIAGVGAMLLLLAAMAALSLLVLRLRRVRLVADAQGLRWDDPYWFSSHALAWEDVIGFERIGRGPVQGLCIRTQDGRCRRLRAYDPTVPAASREVVTTLIGELDSLRRSYARP
jgi:hypothetical protein